MNLVEDSAVTLLRDLVAIDSVNPSLARGAQGEAGIARRIAGELEAIGLQVDIREAAPGRPNVVGVLDIGTSEDRLPYLVMEWLDGQPLDRWLAGEPTVAELIRVIGETLRSCFARTPATAGSPGERLFEEPT